MGRERWFIRAAPPEPDPSFGSEAVHGRSWPESPDLAEPLGASRVRCQTGGSPTDLNSVAQVTTVDWRKTNCDAAVDASSSCNPDGLKTGSSPAAKAAGQTSQPRDCRSAGKTKVFLGVLWPYLKPERVRDNKERQFGGRPVEFGQQASPNGHSPDGIARCSQA